MLENSKRKKKSVHIDAGNSAGMKIAIIVPFYKPSIGGVEYIAYYTARELVKQGLEIHIITTTHDNCWRKVAEPGTTVEDGIYVHRLKPSLIRVGYATIIRGLREILSKIKPDIVHCHNLHPHLFQTITWKQRLGYKIVAQLHHPVATGIDHSVARLLYKPVMKSLVKKQSKVDAFIAHTNMEKQWLINEGIEEEKIHIIRYPCIPDELLEYRPKIDIHEKLATSIVITYISRIHPRKGQHLLIRAAVYLKQQLRDFRIYIAGPPSDREYTKKLYKLIEEYNLKKHIVLEPRPLLENEKLDIIATSDIFACTPIKDIHPTIMLEAIALGTPVIATNVGAIPEYARLLANALTLTSPEPYSIYETLENVLGRISHKVSLISLIKSEVKIFTVSRLTKELIDKVYRLVVLNRHNNT